MAVSPKKYTKRFGTVKGTGNRVEIDGLKETMRALKLLPERAQRKVMRSAVSKACTPVIRMAKKFAPVGEGKNPDGTERKHLNKTLGKNVKTYKNGNVVGIIGPKAGEAPHAKLAEDGAKPHDITLSKPLKLGNKILPAGTVIHHPGAKPSHFLKRALEATQGEAQDAMEIGAAVGIEREAAKLANK